MKPSRIILSILLAIGLAACNMPASQSATPTPIIIPTNTAAPTGVISGMLWHDVCANATTAPNPLPAGCILNSSGGTIGNGVYDLDEPGIAGVQLQLHANDCASPAIAITTTDGGGKYKFENLAAGAYCVTIDAAAAPNASALTAGVWTKPAAPAAVVQQPGALVNGAPLTLDFAWDFQNQPLVAFPTIQPIATLAAPLSTPTPSGTFFVVDTPANCRSGPDTAFAIVTSYDTGVFLTLAGRNGDSSWWYVNVNSTKNCWISTLVGHVNGNGEGVPIIGASSSTTPTVTGIPGVDSNPPLLSDPVVIEAVIYYPSASCGPTNLRVAIRATDEHLDLVWLTYRFVSNNNAYVGGWNSVPANDTPSAGMQGFDYDLASQADSELGGKNGKVEYRFYAKDTLGNETSFPAPGSLRVNIKHCP